jgi:co-chaperonin GroES (HSP10)
MKFIPIGHNILVRVHKEAASSTMIIIPSQKKDEPLLATVLAKGEQCVYPFEVGDTIMISPYAGIIMKSGTDEEPEKLIMEKDMIGIIRHD